MKIVVMVLKLRGLGDGRNAECGGFKLHASGFKLELRTSDFLANGSRFALFASRRYLSGRDSRFTDHVPPDLRPLTSDLCNTPRVKCNLPTVVRFRASAFATKYSRLHAVFLLSAVCSLHPAPDTLDFQFVDFYFWRTYLIELCDRTLGPLLTQEDVPWKNRTSQRWCY